MRAIFVLTFTVGKKMNAYLRRNIRFTTVSIIEKK